MCITLLVHVNQGKNRDRANVTFLEFYLKYKSLQELWKPISANKLRMNRIFGHTVSKVLHSFVNKTVM